MPSIEDKILDLVNKRSAAPIQVQTLGDFVVWREEEQISVKEWGRDNTVQLFQFLVTARHRHALHKEQIIDRIWEDQDGKGGAQNFKVAMHGINKALEPNRKSRTDPRFIIRHGLTYQLNQKEVWIDVDAMEQFVAFGNEVYSDDLPLAKKAYKEAVALYQGIYLPNRLFVDWASGERERIQVLILGTMITLGELLLEENPLESIRLAQQALLIDATWEDAYRLEMEAYLKKGNRPMAIKTYQQCEKILQQEFGIEPLPETQRLLKKIKAIKIED